MQFPQFPNVTIAICTRNRANMLGEAVAGVLQHLDRLGRGALMVIDNGSSDGTPALLAQLAAADPRIVPLHQPKQGLIFARQTAIAAFTGDVLIFIDDDVVPSPTWLSGLLGALADDPGLGVVGAAIDPIWDIERPDWMSDFHLREIPILPLADGPVRYSYPCFPPGVSLALRGHPCLRYYLAPERSACPLGWGAPQPPGFPPIGGEDHDLSEVYLRAGFTLLATDRARVGHRVTADKADHGFYIRKARSDGHLRIRWARLTGRPLLEGAALRVLLGLPLVMALGLIAGLMPPAKGLRWRCLRAKSLGAWRELLVGPRGVRFPYPDPDPTLKN